VVKRYHFKGGPRTHGQSDRLRGPGSLGSGTTPGKERNLLAVNGSVPGPKRGIVMIKEIRKQ